MTKNFGAQRLNELKPLGQRAIAYCKAKGYDIEDFNIIYFEGLTAETTQLNNDALDFWNDTRAVINSEGDVFLFCEATTEPGRYYTINPLNKNGAARIAIGEHKNCWCFGDHKGQDALVQCGPIKVFRDLNKDGFRVGDKVFTGSDYGLNQHTTDGGSSSSIGRWSAGCLVGRYPGSHKIFMQLCRASGKKLFSAIIIDASDFDKWAG